MQPTLKAIELETSRDQALNSARFHRQSARANPDHNRTETRWMIEAVQEARELNHQLIEERRAHMKRLGFQARMNRLEADAYREAQATSPRQFAEQMVANTITHHCSIEEWMAGEPAGGSKHYHYQLGGYVFPPAPGKARQLKPWELYVHVLDRWEIFDVRKLYADALSGTRQPALF